MANTFFDSPPMLRGTENEQLAQLYSYLMTVSDKLNTALMTITIEQMTPETQSVIRESSENREAQNNALKSMIVKTAEIVRTEMQEISTQLNGSVTALSEQFGTYEQELQANIRATAQGILQDYHFEERISGLETDTSGFMRRINQYIFCGLVDPVNMKYGIAIGENVTKQDGTLDTAARMATFTMDELAFYQGESKVAYVTSNAFYITDGVVTKSMTMGRHIWKVLSDNSLALLAGGGV